MQNQQVHGKTSTEHELKMKARAPHNRIQKTNCIQEGRVRPSDLGFFSEKEDEFIEQSTAQQLCTCIINMHQKTFENSKKQQKKISIKGVQFITVWLHIVTANKKWIRRTEQRHRAPFLNTSSPQRKQWKKECDIKNTIIDARIFLSYINRNKQ